MRLLRIVVTAIVVLVLGGCVPQDARQYKYGQKAKKTRKGGKAWAGYVEYGLASWYGMQKGGVYEHGRQTASGARYDMHAMTAAHKTLPLGSRVKVTNLENRRTIVVVINDRGPYIKGRIIDLTLRGARVLRFKDKGTARVKIQVLR